MNSLLLIVSLLLCQANEFKLVVNAPTKVSPGDIVLADTEGSEFTNASWVCYRLHDGKYSQLEIKILEQGKVAVIPPKVGMIYLTCAACKGDQVQIKVVMIECSTDPTPVPDDDFIPPKPEPIIPVIEPEITKWVRTEVSRINSRDLKHEKNIFATNIKTVLQMRFDDPAKFTEKLRELNRASVTENMKTTWADFNNRFVEKLVALNLKTLDDYTKTYSDILKGLE